MKPTDIGDFSSSAKVDICGSFFLKFWLVLAGLE